jgi:replicative DNA helicase
MVLRAIDHEHLVVKTAADVLRSSSARAPQSTFPSGFSELDALTGGGFKSRQLSVVAAPTGDGKTGFCTVIARNISDEVPVLFATTEIEGDEQAARLAAIEYFRIGEPVTVDDILSHRVSPEAAADVLSDVRVYVLDLEDEQAQVDPFAALHDAITTTGARFVVIDYIQLLECDADPRRSVALAAKRLRRLARHLDIAILAISSVSRAYYGKNRKRAAEGEVEDPIDWLAAAKDGGEIEFASAVFMYLDKAPEVDEQGSSAARLIVAKSRRGRRGFVGLRMHGPTGHFEPGIVPRPDGAAQERAAQQRDTEDDAKAFAFIRRTTPNPQPRRIIRTQLGMSKARADAALDRLTVAGRILETKPDNPKARGMVIVVNPAIEAAQEATCE